MDRLALCVARRFASRPIPIDTKAIRVLAVELAEGIATYASQRPADELVGHNTHLFYGHTKAKTVKGEDLRVRWAVDSKTSTASKRLVPSARTEGFDALDDHDGADVKIFVTLNGNRVYGDFTDPEHAGVDGLRFQLYDVLVHEFTHVAEWRYIERQDKPPEYGAHGAAYYNTPSEVRAFLRQILEEILPRASGYRRVTRSKTNHDFVVGLLRTSNTWKRIEHVLTAENEKRILKAVYTALHDAGLV